MTLAIDLRRSLSTVTPGTFIALEAASPEGNRVVSVSGVAATDAQGHAVATFSVSDSQFRRSVTITARTTGVSGPLEASVFLRVVDP
jgi:hypothetical protein